MRLVVGIPWDAPFMWTDGSISLLQLRHPKDVDVRFVLGKGWSSARRHVACCEQALLHKADLLCFLDIDQVYKPDLLERLIERHRDGYQCVAAMVPFRGYVEENDMEPFQPMAWDGDRLIDPEDGDMQRITHIGSGVFMFPVDLLQKMKPPWLFERVEPLSQRREASMDSTFCERLRMEAGAEVWVDTTIEVDHIHPFKMDRSFMSRFGDWKEGGGDPELCVYKRKT